MTIGVQVHPPYVAIAIHPDLVLIVEHLAHVLRQQDVPHHLPGYFRGSRQRGSARGHEGEQRELVSPPGQHVLDVRAVASVGEVMLEGDGVDGLELKPTSTLACETALGLDHEGGAAPRQIRLAAQILEPLLEHGR